MPRCSGYVPIQLLTYFVSPCKCVCVFCKVYRVYYASHHIRLVCFLSLLYQCILTAPANSDDPPSTPATERLGPGNLPRGANGATWAMPIYCTTVQCPVSETPRHYYRCWLKFYFKKKTFYITKDVRACVIHPWDPIGTLLTLQSRQDTKNHVARAVQELTPSGLFHVSRLMPIYIDNISIYIDSYHTIKLYKLHR